MKPHRKNILVICLLAAGTVAAGELAAQIGSEDAGRGEQVAHFIFNQNQAAGEGSLATDHSIQMISSGYSVAGKLVTQAPYSAESITEMVQTLPGGNRIVRENTTMIYRDSQGRTRREQQLGAIGPWATAGESAKMIFIHDPVAGVHFVLNPQDQSARKMSSLHMDATQNIMVAQGESAQPGAQIRRYSVVTGNTDEHEEHRWVSGNVTTDGINVMVGVPTIAGAGEHALHDVKTESLGTRVIEGLEAQGAKTVTTIPAGAIGNEQPIEIVSEQWFSEELQITVLSTREDPRFGRSTLRLANVQRVEPLPSLFEVPPGYVIEEGLGSSPAVHRSIERNATPPR